MKGGPRVGPPRRCGASNLAKRMPGIASGGVARSRHQLQPACQDSWQGQQRGCAQQSAQARSPGLRPSAATLEAAPASEAGVFPLEHKAGQKGPTVLIAGAGIGGLVLAVGLLKRGVSVKIFERDVTAVRGEGKYRGPIQVQSNALAALEALDASVADKVLAEGCITGDRINGLCDGVTGHWYVKFDTFHPAVDKGLPVTRVISRVVLQNILAEACMKMGGKDIICNDCQVVDYEEKIDEMGRKRVWAIMSDGRRYEGDILIGADGIWSKVRTSLLGPSKPCYSQYTCYTGIADFMPPDIDTVGYRVFLGNRQYFVSSDVGDGKMQWYAFHKEPEGGKDAEGQKKARLLNIFGHWTDMVTDLIKATPEDDVLRRDIFDRPPIFRWTKGHVALLGDSAHAMQPNLGQGGCMAIEDGFQLSTDLSEAIAQHGMDLNIEAILKGYQNKRMMRASTIHGLAGSAAIMASTYKAYLGEGLGAVGQQLMKLRIPHPGKVGGYVAMNLAIGPMLSWVLGGNVRVFDNSHRRPLCHISDKPKNFDERDFRTFLKDDRALLKAAGAHWLLVPAVTKSLEHSAAVDREPGVENREDHLDAVTHSHGLQIALPDEAREIDRSGLVIGVGPGCNVHLNSPSVSGQVARLEQKDDGDYYVTALNGGRVWLNGRQLAAGRPQCLVPGDRLEFGAQGAMDLAFQVKMCHRSVWQQLAKAAAGNGSIREQHGVPVPA